MCGLLYMLWLKFFFGLKIFRPASFIPFVSDSLSYSETKENKNQTGFKKEKIEPRKKCCLKFISVT